jgi:hypothetical protein
VDWNPTRQRKCEKRKNDGIFESSADGKRISTLYRGRQWLQGQEIFVHIWIFPCVNRIQAQSKKTADWEEFSVIIRLLICEILNSRPQ